MKRFAFPPWQRLSPRDRRALAVLLALLGAGLVWAVAVRPAWHTLRNAPAVRAAAEQQWQRVRALADEAQQLRARPPSATPDRAATLQALSQATEATLAQGATLHPQPDRVVVTLIAAPPPALAQWLQQVHREAHLLPLETELQRNAPDWSGTIVLTGPGLSAP
ncbi:type II secretion system protein GspM [Aquabacterium sp. A08]|uniref:type II secretion system protein GspM n=1 Tax=Aquabacterium sp. A08 TaxID=2718532 RepID=UPI00141D98E2|nr:type II secretion system protein GspM [Aquabacterium sp. A08]NIC42236.1 type II secretion system protein M [Aquabacterium sp. A08]